MSVKVVSGNCPLAAAILLLLPAMASAGSILDSIRNYDLNDYALGVTVSVSQNPYTMTQNSVIVYPYLTSFTYPAFTDDWILLSDGELGVRKVMKNGWEFGVVGRIQTLGFGSQEPDELLGLDDRQWTIEAAPFVGYRGWPVHFKFKTFAEISGRHDGWTQEFEVSLPFQRSWGYIVPSIEVARLDEKYTGYYYSVTADEAQPGRPEYQPGSAINVSAAFRIGYQISNKWLLSANLAYERLDDEIFNSPIVDRDHLWSWNLGVAYNADIFQRREYDGESYRMPRFEIRAGIFNDSVSTTIIRNADDGTPGEPIDVEDALALAGEQSILQLEAIVRIGQFHRLEFGYFDFGRDSSLTLLKDLEFGDELFPAGSTVDINSNLQIARAAYAFSLMNDAQKEIGVMMGMHLSRMKVDVHAPSSGQRETTVASTPLPVVGVHGSIALGPKTRLAARLQIFRMHFDHYKGSMNYFNLVVQHMFTQRVSIGGGYSFYAIKLDSDHNDINGSLEVLHQGPFVFVGAHF
jgi:outer membrane scaffolding protein for murein synthesis (MipA/OmpV family)